MDTVGMGTRVRRVDPMKLLPDARDLCHDALLRSEFLVGGLCTAQSLRDLGDLRERLEELVHLLDLRPAHVLKKAPGKVPAERGFSLQLTEYFRHGGPAGELLAPGLLHPRRRPRGQLLLQACPDFSRLILRLLDADRNRRHLLLLGLFIFGLRSLFFFFCCELTSFLLGVKPRLELIGDPVLPVVSKPVCDLKKVLHDGVGDILVALGKTQKPAGERIADGDTDRSRRPRICFRRQHTLEECVSPCGSTFNGLAKTVDAAGGCRRDQGFGKTAQQGRAVQVEGLKRGAHAFGSVSFSTSLVISILSYPVITSCSAPWNFSNS